MSIISLRPLAIACVLGSGDVGCFEGVLVVFTQRRGEEESESESSLSGALASTANLSGDPPSLGLAGGRLGGRVELASPTGSNRWIRFLGGFFDELIMGGFWWLKLGR